MIQLKQNTLINITGGVFTDIINNLSDNIPLPLEKEKEMEFLYTIITRGICDYTFSCLALVWI